MDIDPKTHLASFLGPKAEQGDLLISHVTQILQDYIHWRRNYFPEDPRCISTPQKRSFIEHQETLEADLLDLLAAMRKNFPFYSPRYIAHQLSDTTLPSLLGYIAGLLYNPNNVTPEASPVTADLEYEACTSLIQMIGFTVPPEPKAVNESSDDFSKRLKDQFGWAHISPGGTTANIEALWVARNVKYFPLSVQQVAQQQNMALRIKSPDGIEKPVSELTQSELLRLKPNESIFMLQKLMRAVEQRFPNSNAPTKTWDLLNRTGLGLHNCAAALYAVSPPKIFVSGAAHYSIVKAADILGIGRNNVEIVGMSDGFRLDVGDLRARLRKSVTRNETILAVIGILGTTEEGACDPIHDLIDLRKEFERTEGVSFWIHVDAAWGGFIKSIFNFGPEEVYGCHLVKSAKCLGLGYPRDLSLDLIKQKVKSEIKSFQRILVPKLVTEEHQAGGSDPGQAAASEVGGTGRLGEDDTEANESPVPPVAGAKVPGSDTAHGDSDSSVMPGRWDAQHARDAVRNLTGALDSLALAENVVESGDFAGATGELKTAIRKIMLANLTDAKQVETRITLEDRLDYVSRYVSKDIWLSLGKYRQKVGLSWCNGSVLRAFLATSHVDSITLDAHKMGYVPYPSGAIAFRNDRVRQFIAQHAPYITSVELNTLDHVPLKHTANRSAQAYAPFVLEGSRPGAAACSLWLATRVIPLTTQRHGRIVRSSLLAARELYEWISRWAALSEKAGIDRDYFLVPISTTPPDTNIVCFVVQKKGNHSSLDTMNKMSMKVYQEFSIETELGPSQHSYSQPFFLSKTTMGHPYYPWKSVESLLTDGSRCNLRDCKASYRSKGVVVLRATVMSPYYAEEAPSVGSVFSLFMDELDLACQKAVMSLHQRG